MLQRGPDPGRGDGGQLSTNLGPTVRMETMRWSTISPHFCFRALQNQSVARDESRTAIRSIRHKLREWDPKTTWRKQSGSWGPEFYRADSSRVHFQPSRLLSPIRLGELHLQGKVVLGRTVTDLGSFALPHNVENVMAACLGWTGYLLRREMPFRGVSWTCSPQKSDSPDAS